VSLPPPVTSAPAKLNAGSLFIDLAGQSPDLTGQNPDPSCQDPDLAGLDAETTFLRPDPLGQHPQLCSRGLTRLLRVQTSWVRTPT